MTSTPSAATPTPELPEQAAEERIARRIEPWHKIAAAVAGLVLLGVSFGAAWQRVATKADVEREHAAGAAALAPVAAEVRVLAVKQAAVDEAISFLKADTAFMKAQLTEIAKAVGARQVVAAPDPAPSSQVPAP